jgi:ectoine hydroxylase-related dioxygenase (phytanoyl-CoA dioxygenase family)
LARPAERRQKDKTIMPSANAAEGHMKTELSQDQIREYRERGFIHIPGFLDPREVQELKAGVLEAISTMGRKRLADRETFQDGDDFYSRVFTQRLNLWRHNATVKKYMLAPELGRMTCRLTGVKAMRVWHDQALIKEPFGNPTAWHLDNPYWSFHSLDATSVWIALEDATLANGCMWFVPGTHKLATHDNVGIGPNMGALFGMYPKMAEIDPVAAPMKAGDCSFHNGLVAHGAGANMTRGRRIAMTCAFMPDGSTFNGTANVLPSAYLSTLKVGDLLRNDDWNPVVGRMDAGE